MLRQVALGFRASACFQGLWFRVSASRLLVYGLIRSGMLKL